MLQPFFQKYNHNQKPVESLRSLLIVSSVLIFVIGIMVIQDFLEALRSGYSFYLSESLLFKTVWLLFIPILIILYKTLQREQLDTFYKTLFYIVVPVSVHLVLLPFVFLVFSVLFYDGRYDLYKIVSFTLANDLYKLIFIYTVFVLGYKYFKESIPKTAIVKQKAALESILISQGKEVTIIKVYDIFTITSATPYITIQLEAKKLLHTETLKSIGEQLNNKQFVRVHKSAIVNVEKVVSFKSRLNGDYDLLLNNGHYIRLSRTYAAHFKSLFQSSHQVKP
uniref:LytR/AlgR family response regulator transcription factor n=1 Tax=Gelidibacter sp. TaxID=2018083 RepID=UPI0040495799